MNYQAIVSDTCGIVESTMAEQHSYQPPNGFVPDEATAIAIATAVWLPIYGQQVLTKRPYRASLAEKVWTVSGVREPLTPGGVPIAEIAQMDAQILRVSHGQ